MSGLNVPGGSWPALTDEQRQRVSDNLGLVGWILRRRNTPTDEWDDSFADGVLGLIRAAQMFDPERGFKFSTYAINWIRQGVGRGRHLTLGGNYRRAVERGEDWRAPVSLDLDLADDLTLADLMPCDATPTDEAALAACMLAEVRQALDEWELDDIDRLIADDLLATDSTRGRDKRIAERAGCSSEYIRQRRMRLQSRLRRAVA